MPFWDSISEKLGLTPPKPVTPPPLPPPRTGGVKPIDVMREGLLGRGAPRGRTGNESETPSPKKGAR